MQKETEGFRIMLLIFPLNYQEITSWGTVSSSHARQVLGP